ncbi:helix-turn-helix transcriptional regulator [Haloarcula rara]|nr:helix-turn-helix domain-containing protein [Halomicroarcula sp. SHR3]
MPPAKNHAGVVAKRQDVLAALETGMRKPELVDHLSLSRSTVDRAIDELQEASLVERDGSHYVTTYAGRESLAAYEGYLDRLDALAEAQPVLSALPPDVDVDPAALEGAQVVQSTPAAPEGPIEVNVDPVQRAETLRTTSPVVAPRYLEAVDNLIESGTDIELVYTEAAFEALSTTYESALKRVEAAADVHGFVTDRPIPYIVWTAEVPDGTISGLIVHDDTGLVGLINNDTEAMNEWARTEYERYRADAEQVY